MENISGKNTLSERGSKVLNRPMRIDLELFFEASENLYSGDNQDGAFPLCMAENRLCWEMLRKKMESVTHGQKIPAWVPAYTSPMGSPVFREAVSDFMATFLTKCPINPEHLGCSSGAAGVIEVTTAVLADPGDVAVFPAPAYPVYREDVHSMAGMERYDLQTHHHVDELDHGPLLTVSQLEKTLVDLKGQGKRFRMLVLTQPDNPTGLVYRTTMLREMAEWCIDNHIHLVVNEIYGLSIFNEGDFQSFAPILLEKNSDYLHLWYAFSKDFGISGLRLGLVYSLNEAFLQAYGRYNIGHMASNYTQWVVGEVLRDQSFVRQYIQMNQRLLTDCFKLVTSTLDDLTIPYVNSHGGLFVWADFSKYLKDQSREGEHAFWISLYESTGVLLTPGQGFGHRGFGRFRIICSFLPLAHLKVAMEKLKKHLLAVEGRDF